MAKDLIEQLAHLLRDADVRICFCTLCSHDREYGYCYACRCNNGAKQRPPVDEHEAEKMLATIDHWRNLAIEFKKERDNMGSNSGTAPASGTNS